MSKTTMRRFLIVTLGLALTAIPSQIVAEEINREYHETFDTRPGMKLVLEHGDGDVTISTWSEDSLAVDVRYRAKAASIGWSKSTDFTVDFRQEGDTIHVIGHEPKRVSVGISAFREYEYTYTIQAPSYLELSTEGEDGNVEIGGWRGSIGLKLEDGDVNLNDIDAARIGLFLEDGDLTADGIRGEVDVESEDGDIEISDCEITGGVIRTEDGDIEIDRCQGSLELTLEDGDVHLRDMAAQDLEIRSSDGSITLSLLPSEGLDLRARSDDGDVVLDLDPAIAARFDLETDDGRIKVNAADVADLEQERRHVRGRLGTGEGSIYVRTSDGSVTLRQ